MVYLKELLIKFDEPENFPLLSEIFSKMLVITAEQNLEISNSPYFPRAVIDAYKKICKVWRSDLAVIHIQQKLES